MGEKIIELENINPVEILGVNDRYLKIIKEYFPKLKIIARGNSLKVNGTDEEIERFEDKINTLLLSFEKFGRITEKDLNQILTSDDQVHLQESSDHDVLVRGNNGLRVKTRTPNQHRMAESSEKNDLLFAIGPAGTGKTYTAVALAVRALKNREVKRIILTRPAVEAGENLGFLPGDMREKLDPYLQPLYDALRDMIHPQKLLSYLEDGTIEVAPLAFMRGRTLDNAFVILDEAQNTTKKQLKMFLTRMGQAAKFIVTGDITQIDLPGNQKSGLIHAVHILKDINGVDFIYLDASDIIRHRLVSDIIRAYSDENEKKSN
ncbi:MAG: PhoH family protein [Bacteroidales bacterium]|nr:PhoH family protein [Bacteroidales bacterium]MCF8333414.1 PhoH family protein [Bacteroidales bacterium]